MHHSWFHSNQPWKHLQARASLADQATEINPSQRRTEREERNTRTCNVFRLFKSLSFGTELHPAFYIFKRRARRTASARRTENIRARFSRRQVPEEKKPHCLRPLARERR